MYSGANHGAVWLNSLKRVHGLADRQTGLDQSADDAGLQHPARCQEQLQLTSQQGRLPPLRSLLASASAAALVIGLWTGLQQLPV